jgi:hypothetical protein
VILQDGGPDTETADMVAVEAGCIAADQDLGALFAADRQLGQDLVVLLPP